MTRLILACGIVMLSCLTPHALDQFDELLLWPHGLPGDEQGDVEVSKIFIHLPEEDINTGVGVVVCPGGGYGHLAMGHEGDDVAAWLNKHGIAAFVLKYRIAPDFKHPAPMQDVQRAIRMVRYHAERFSVNPDKVGVLGFSAGGHLASTAATHFDAGDPDSPFSIDQKSSRPDFAVLIYPVITLDGPYAHKGSRRNLLGENPDPVLVEQLSNHKQVTAETPPTFLVHTYNDTGVPPENSILFYMSLRENKVPAEMHLYETGKHGFGLAPDDSTLSTWPDHCIAWLKTRGILE